MIPCKMKHDKTGFSYRVSICKTADSRTVMQCFWVQWDKKKTTKSEGRGTYFTRQINKQIETHKFYTL